MNIPSCDLDSGNQVTIQWTEPTDTGGQNVDIDRYVVNVTGPAGVTCSPDPCNMITGTATTTTITGLQCNTSYTVTVRAVNCIGEGNSSNPLIIPSSGKAAAVCHGSHVLKAYKVGLCVCVCVCVCVGFHTVTDKLKCWFNTVQVDLCSHNQPAVYTMCLLLLVWRFWLTVFEIWLILCN